jgi:hypothetical protein
MLRIFSSAADKGQGMIPLPELRLGFGLLFLALSRFFPGDVEVSDLDVMGGPES